MKYIFILLSLIFTTSCSSDQTISHEGFVCEEEYKEMDFATRLLSDLKSANYYFIDSECDEELINNIVIVLSSRDVFDVGQRVKITGRQIHTGKYEQFVDGQKVEKEVPIVDLQSFEIK